MVGPQADEGAGPATDSGQDSRGDEVLETIPYAGGIQGGHPGQVGGAKRVLGLRQHPENSNSRLCSEDAVEGVSKSALLMGGLSHGRIASR